ncbi:MAG: MFS transporter [Elusimicrobiota bacterium]|jgi:MFS family permease
MRIWLALLLTLSSWQPAAAAAIAGTTVSCPVSSPLPAAVLTPDGLPVAGTPNNSLGNINSPLPVLLIPTLSNNQALLPAPGAKAGARVFLPKQTVAATRDLSSSPKKLPAVRIDASARSAKVLPGKGSSDLSAAINASAEQTQASPSPEEQADALRRLFDGSSRIKPSAEPVDAAAPTKSAELPLLDKPAVSPAPQPQVPNAAVQRKALRPAMIGTAFYKFGMESLSIAMPLIVLHFFGGAMWMLTTAAVWGLSMAAATMGSGGLIDRIPVQKIMSASLIVEAAAVAGIIGVLVFGAANPWTILPLYALSGAAEGIAVTAQDTFPALLLGHDAVKLKNFNANVYLSYEGAGILAPVLIGVLIVMFGIPAGLAVTPPAFLLSAWAFSRLKIDPAAKEQHPTRPSLWQSVKSGVSELRDGARIMLGDKEKRWLGIMLVGPMLLHRIIKLMLAPIFAKTVLNASGFSAWIAGISNLGELIGATLLLRPAKPSANFKKASPLPWIRFMALTTLGILAFASRTLWPVMAAVFAMGLSYAANKVSVTSYLQSRLPNESAGKAIAFLDAVGLVVLIAVGALFGVLFDLLPATWSLVAASAILSALAGVFYKAYRRLRAVSVPGTSI